VIELALYQESYDDYGGTITEESRMAVADFVAKGEGPRPAAVLVDGWGAVRRIPRRRRRRCHRHPASRRAGVTERHRELAASAGASQVEAALRR
jgi:hypothetical protein